MNNLQQLWIGLTLGQQIEMKNIAKTGRYDNEGDVTELERLHLVFVDDPMRKRASLIAPIGRNVLRAGDMQFYLDWWRELDINERAYLINLHKSKGHTNVHPPIGLRRTLVNPYGEGYVMDEKGADLVEAWIEWDREQTSIPHAPRATPPDTISIEVPAEAAAMLTFWRGAINKSEIIKDLHREVTDGEVLKIALVFTHMSISNLSNPVFQHMAGIMAGSTLAAAVAISLNICPPGLPQEVFDLLVKITFDMKTPSDFGMGL